MSYINRIKKQIKCDFCDSAVIKDQEINSLSGKYWHVLASKYPYVNGNVIIIPKRHLADTSDLTSEEMFEYFQVLEKTKKILGRLFKTKSFNLALNLGPDSGQTITHLHWQLVPRQKFNPNAYNLLNNFWLVSLDYKDLIKKIKKIT